MTSNTPTFTRDAILGLSVEAAKSALPRYEEAVQADLNVIADQERMTVVKAAYTTRLAVRAGLLKIGRGGKKVEGTITTAEYGARFVGANGNPVSASTVGLWTNLGMVLVDVKGFDMDNERHALLFRRLATSGAGTAKVVTDAIRDEKASVAKIEKALSTLVNIKTGAKVTKKAAESPAETTPSDSDGATDETGAPAPVAPVRSALERALEGIRAAQVALPDLQGADLQRFARAFQTLADEVKAATDALADMEAETAKAPERAANRGGAKKSA